MEKIVRILIVIIMMIKVVPAFSQSGIWNNEGLPTGFGTQKEETGTGEIFVSAADDSKTALAIGEELTRTPVHDGMEVVMVASFLYGVYLVRKQNRKKAIL